MWFKLTVVDLDTPFTGEVLYVRPISMNQRENGRYYMLDKIYLYCDGFEGFPTMATLTCWNDSDPILYAAWDGLDEDGIDHWQLTVKVEAVESLPIPGGA